MNEKNVITKTYPLKTMIAGFISFFISSLLTAFFCLKIGEGVIPILGIPLGALIMTQLLRKLEKNKIINIILLSIFAGILSFIAGFMGGYVFEWLCSLVGYSEDKIRSVANVIVCIISNITFGLFFAYYYFGEKAVKIFAFISTAIAIPFGILINSKIYVPFINMELNLILFLISFGTSVGLSYGVYSLLNNEENIK